MFLAKKLNKGAGTPATTDPQFNYVTMLLHGDGTNGAQNNTFLDSSTNAFTVTRSGNVTQGSFSPYGSNWSNYLNGASGAGGGPYLSFPNSSTMQLGAGNFTIEAWCYFNVVQESAIVARYPFDGTNNEWIFQTGSTLIPNFAYTTTGGNTATGSVGINYSLLTNTWYHIAVVRNSTTLTMYINGTSVATSAISATIYSGTTASTVGCYAQSAYPNGYAVPNGYLSNVRVVKGTAVYTSNFTPSTTPLTAISGTSLLTCQSNRFVDNSTNNFAVTINQTPSVQRFNPFGASTAYSTSVIGGSGYFDGAVTFDKLQTTGTVGIANSAFTICCWFYPLNSSVIGLFDSGPLSPTVLRNYDANSIEQQGGTRISFAGSYKVNAWNWMCITKSGTSFTVYVNGVSQGTGSCASTLTESTFTVGVINIGNDGAFYGYISDFQVLNTATVVGIPTAPITNASGKTYLLNFQNGAIFDNAMMNNLETVGNAQISTSVVKYGTGSLSFGGGTTNYLQCPALPIFLFNGNFTIECWFYKNGAGTFGGLFGNYTTNAFSNWTVQLGSTNVITWYYDSAGSSITSSTTFSVTTWNHVACVRNGSTLTLYLNGVSVGTATFSTAYGSSSKPFFVGQANNDCINGYIDDVRITNGIARYTTTFTPPTAAFFNTGPY